MTWSILARDAGGRFGVAIASRFFLLVLAFNLLGDGLRDVLDSRQR